MASRVKYDYLVGLQEAWKETKMPDWERDGLIELSNKLMKKFIDNNHSAENVFLYYPDDCHNMQVFMDLAYCTDSDIIFGSEGEPDKMYGFHACIEL